MGRGKFRPCRYFEKKEGGKRGIGKRKGKCAHPEFEEIEVEEKNHCLNCSSRSFSS